LFAPKKKSGLAGQTCVQVKALQKQALNHYLAVLLEEEENSVFGISLIIQGNFSLIIALKYGDTDVTLRNSNDPLTCQVP